MTTPISGGGFVLPPGHSAQFEAWMKTNPMETDPLAKSWGEVFSRANPNADPKEIAAAIFEIEKNVMDTIKHQMDHEQKVHKEQERIRKEMVEGG